jgi:beta-lactam-binding protein with PASTA domain
MPDTGSSVKTGRTIFLTINKAEPPLTPMPKLTDLSFRSAIRILESARLIMGDTIHKPDFAKGAVLEQRYKGKPITAGDMIPQGSRIDLVVGDGLNNVEMDVPDVIGSTADEGITILNGAGLSPIIIWDGIITDSSSAFIYKETPAPYNELEVPNRIKEGDVIDIRIKQNPTNQELEDNRKPANAVNNEVPNTLQP